MTLHYRHPPDPTILAWVTVNGVDFACYSNADKARYERLAAGLPPEEPEPEPVVSDATVPPEAAVPVEDPVTVTEPEQTPVEQATTTIMESAPVEQATITEEHAPKSSRKKK